MHIRLLLLLCSLVLALPARADTASHRKAATDLLRLINGPETMRIGFNAMVDPMLANLKNQGAPEAALVDFKAALKDWLDKEIIWEELADQLVELYMREFTEAELQDLASFYKSPTGAKALKSLPAIMGEGMAIGQKYAATKQASLMRRIQAVVEKHQLK